MPRRQLRPEVLPKRALFRLLNPLRHSTLVIPIQPPNSTVQCIFVACLPPWMLPFPVRPATIFVRSVASSSGTLLRSPRSSRFAKIVARGRTTFYPTSPFAAPAANLFPTPLFLITSMQPPHFHAIAHSFPQRRLVNPNAFSALRTLLPLTTNIFSPLRFRCRLFDVAPVSPLPSAACACPPWREYFPSPQGCTPTRTIHYSLPTLRGREWYRSFLGEHSRHLVCRP